MADPAQDTRTQQQSAERDIKVDLTGRLGAFPVNVRFETPADGVTMLFGPSGCGKTTILRAMAGLDRLSGSIRMRGQVWQDDEAGIFRPPHQRNIGYVLQEASLFPHLSVNGNLAYGMERLPPGKRKIQKEDIADILDLPALEKRRPGTLSGGQRQRVAIARALLRSPELLLMDEPLAALDYKARQDITRALRDIRAKLGIPVLYVSHDPDEVANLADHLILLENGSVRVSGPVTELCRRLDLASDPETGDVLADTILNASVAGVDPEWGLTRLESPAGDILVPQQGWAPGAQVRIRIMARDVSIALSPAPDSSILNMVPGVVTDIVRSGPGQCLVRLRCGEGVLFSLLTRKSVETLNLQPGAQVIAQIKSVAMIRPGR